jgi:hypothetical protein
MSTPASNDGWASLVREGPWGRLLPWIALFARCMVGLCLLNFGTMVLINSGPNASPPSSELGAVIIWILLQAVPYMAIAIGLGLVFGIYTTLNALLACGLTLILPLVMLVAMIGQSALGTGGPGVRGNPFGTFGPEFGIGLMFAAYAVFIVPCLVTLVLLSPMQINRYSLDTLMFGKPKRFEAPNATPPSPQRSENPFDLNKPEGESPN